MYSSHESVYPTDPSQWNQHQIICKQQSWYNDPREINSLLHGMKNYPQAREIQNKKKRRKKFFFTSLHPLILVQ